MTSPAFVLSTEQQGVVAHRGGHLQVVACAGAGKTEAISRRVSTLIEEGVETAHTLFDEAVL
jgi:DNA helicase-2/ATP-dependent DNA helicase PcrA